MIGTEFIKGQGLGNQLFCYVTARAIAQERGFAFGTAGREQLGNNIHSRRGMYFMDMDLGQDIGNEEKKKFARFDEAEVRLYLGNSRHDREYGCYVSGQDESIHRVRDNTLLYGNLQAEDYFIKYRDRLREWLAVKPEYDSYEYSRENLCILNMRGGEYTGSPELYIDRRYWIRGMKYMKSIRADMEFMIVTDDVEAARKMLPGIPAFHFDMGKDFVTIKNAHYLLLSNSSFACIATFLSEQQQYIIAPKYWARYNVSDGYWASEQNIYSLYHYQDRKGRLFTAQACRAELDAYKKKRSKYLKRRQKPGTAGRIGQILLSRAIQGRFMARKAVRALMRRIHGIDNTGR